MAKIMNLDGTQQLDLTRGSVEQAYDELNVTEIPRNWLQVVARAV